MLVLQIAAGILLSVLIVALLPRILGAIGVLLLAVIALGVLLWLRTWNRETWLAIGVGAGVLAGGAALYVPLARHAERRSRRRQWWE